MDIKSATEAYESWLGKRIALLQDDLKLKHESMVKGVFPFLRATFYRWIQIWPEVCPEFTRATAVLGVGDLHVENFGTWRDAEGRLIWGINDFDEAFEMPYTNDLMRLAVSAALAIRQDHLSCDPKEASEAILAGYEESLEKGGTPYVLSEQHRWLRDLAIGELRDPTRYWEKMRALPDDPQQRPAPLAKALQEALPERGLESRWVRRRAGLGSLGRRRFTLLTAWRGGQIAREAKELTVSAWLWDDGPKNDSKILYRQILDRAVRAPDPFVTITEPWLIRRLAPDCSRIELSTLPKPEDELRLLRAMGRETANIHLGTKDAAPKILGELKKQSVKGFHKAIEAMVKATSDDWKAWAKT